MLRYGKIQKLVRNKKPTRTYFVRTYDPETGKRGWVTTGCTSLAAAREWRRTREVQEAIGPARTKEATAARVNFKDACRAWLAEKDGAVSAKHHQFLTSLAENFWLPAFSRRLLRQIGSEEIQLYLKRRRLGTLPSSTKPLSATSVNQDRKDLNTFFNWCRRRGWLRENPVHAVAEHSGEMKRKRRYISRDEEERLLEACRTAPTVEVTARRNLGGRHGGKTSQPVTFKQTARRPDWLYPVVLVALRCGFRRGTLLRLRWRHVSFDSKRWRVPGEIMKSGRDYDAPIPGSVLAALNEYRENLALSWAQSGRNPLERVGEDARIFGLSDNTYFRRPFQAACRQAGLKLSFHDLRGCFLNRCCETGVDIGTAMRLSDHKSLEVVLKHYREVRQSELEKAVAAIDGVGAAQNALQGSALGG